MISVAQLIEQLQEIERRVPGSQIMLGERSGDGAYENFGINQRQVTTRVWRGIGLAMRWVGKRAGRTVFVLEPK
jgi:hypothetical protein